VTEATSRNKHGTPTLYLVATPIGNLEDITLRALRILKEVDFIASEDTRRTAKLLNHYGIRTPQESHHEHNQAQSTARLLSFLRQGKSVALVTDAGTPSISDPGYMLVAACRREAVPVVPVPGPSAALAALVGSGLSTESFYFAGFLAPRAARRRKRLQELSSLSCTLIFYEAPHRLIASLEDMLSVLGPRRACLARELTKAHEEWLHGRLSDILDTVRSRSRIRGEITIVVERGEPARQSAAYPASLREHLEQEMRATGASNKEALRSVARQRGIARKEAYRLLLTERSE
jgi:16S rRNA (cytidine1402-2'-O)-methyltransferase